MKISQTILLFTIGFLSLGCIEGPLRGLVRVPPKSPIAQRHSISSVKFKDNTLVKLDLIPGTKSAYESHYRSEDNFKSDFLSKLNNNSMINLDTNSPDSLEITEMVVSSKMIRGQINTMQPQAAGGGAFGATSGNSPTVWINIKFRIYNNETTILEGQVESESSAGGLPNPYLIPIQSAVSNSQKLLSKFVNGNLPTEFLDQK